MIKQIEQTCVQCHEHLVLSTGTISEIVYCINPSCPNFGLHAESVEALEKTYDDKKICCK